MEQKNEKGYIVRLSENAVISMILNALEAYAISHQNISGKGKPKFRIESGGSLFGHEIILPDEQKVYQIDVASTDTSAEMGRSELALQREAALLKIDLVSSFWPHLEYIGDFHTHPYKHYKEVLEIKGKGYYFSKDDEENSKELASYLKKRNMRYRVGLAVTIGYMKRWGEKECTYIDSNENCLVANFGNLKLWIAAYCTYSDNGKISLTKDKDPSVTLDCPALMGLVWEHVDFGRIRYKEGKFNFEPSHYLQKGKDHK